jgi:hypothetical protein
MTNAVTIGTKTTSTFGKSRRFRNHQTETLVRYLLACERTITVFKAERIVELISELKHELETRHNATVCHIQK